MRDRDKDKIIISLSPYLLFTSGFLDFISNSCLERLLKFKDNESVSVKYFVYFCKTKTIL